MEGYSSAGTHPAKLSWLRAVRPVFPIALGYIPVGFAYGVLSQKTGLSAANTLLMSVIVYAGSSQLIAVGLLGAGAPALSVVLTTFVVNLRHLLMSAAVSPHLKSWKRRELLAFAFHLTDETFAVHISNFAVGSPSKAAVFLINIIAQTSWVLGTWLGVVGGGLVTDVERFALDYALLTMFIALLVLQIKDYLQVVVAILTGLLSVGLLMLGMEQWHVIGATLLGATAGVVIEKWIKK